MTNALYALAPGSLRIMRGGACLADITRADLSADETADFAEKITAALNAYNPAHQPFMDLPPAERRAAVQAGLDVVLRGLLAAVGTDVISAEVAKLVIEHTPTKDETARLISDLMFLAPHTPEASRSEATFERFGRKMRRWVWSPRT